MHILPLILFCSFQADSAGFVEGWRPSGSEGPLGAGTTVAYTTVVTSAHRNDEKLSSIAVQSGFVNHTRSRNAPPNGEETETSRLCHILEQRGFFLSKLQHSSPGENPLTDSTRRLWCRKRNADPFSPNSTYVI